MLWPKSIVLGMILLLSLMLGACTGAKRSCSFCTIYIPVHTAENEDTKETEDAVTINNVAYETLRCGK